MSSNEEFIMKVFNGMVEYKPKLALYLEDDDDEDDDFDIRELSNIITKSFPWPIGLEIRRLLSGSMEELNRGRIDQIFKTIERVLQFFSFVLLSQLQDHKLNNGDLEIPESFSKQFKKRFMTLSMGNYIWLIRSIMNIMEEHSIDPFVGEMKEVFTKKFLNNLEYWAAQRNELGHYQVNLEDEEIEVRCNEYQEKLGQLLCDIAFIINYPLVTVADVKLIKAKREPEHYLHSMLILNSSSSSFIVKKHDFTNYTDTHSVLLVGSIKKAPERFLNLSPLIIDTHHEVMESRDKLTRLKKDIYLYSKWDMKKQQLSYIGTEATDKPDIKLVSFYDHLVQRVEEIFNTFSLE